MTYLRNLFSGVFVALLVVPAWAQAPAGELGRWVTESGNLEVEIAPCGAALCGTVVEVLANRSMSNPGTTMTPAARPVLGIKILTDFVPGGDRQWKGYIYNRENGKTYRCRMTLLESGHLEIHAYVGLPLFGKTQIWRRVADPGRSSQ